jgi:energy-coupling factor transporter ATP-binding protein EcfA2
MTPTPPARGYEASAFGLAWRSDIALPHFISRAPSTEPPDVVVRQVSSLANRRPLAHINRGFVYDDGVRFVWEREVAFDLYDGNRIDYVVGDNWREALPRSFYSTMAALTLAWRGAIPLHACAVELEGHAVLICGPAGAGKSTLAAGLLAEGARFIADDLSVVACAPANTPDLVHLGRPTMRLHAATVDWLDCVTDPFQDGDLPGKILIRPPAMSYGKGVPLAGFLMLGRKPETIARPFHYPLIQTQVFRPRWLAALPNAAARAKAIFSMSQKVHMVWFETAEVRTEILFHQRAIRAHALIRTAILSS